MITIPDTGRSGDSGDPASDHAEMLWEYNTALFDSATIHRFAEQYQRILKAVVQAPDTPLSQLPLITEEERHTILVEWNDTWVSYPRESSIPELFGNQVARAPDAVAVAAEGRELTYGELDERARQVARSLRALDVGPDVPVGVCFDRSLEAIISSLAVLMAGGAYVPLDACYPRQRLSYMIRDTAMPILLCQEDLRGRLPEAPARVVTLPELEGESLPGSHTRDPAAPAPEDLAYIVYTSGSTGEPKGVCVTHRNVVGLVANVEYVQLDDQEVVLQLATTTFDAATFEIWGPLLNGGRVVLPPPGLLSLQEIGTVIQDQGVTTPVHDHSPVSPDGGREPPGIPRCTPAPDRRRGAFARPHQESPGGSPGVSGHRLLRPHRDHHLCQLSPPELSG